MRERASPGTLTDAEVIASSAVDGSRFALLFDRHARSVHRYVHRRLGRDPAEDITAETFAVAFSRRFEFDPARGDARPWLFGIAANLLRNHRRAERRRLLAYARTGAEPVTDGGFDRTEERVDAEAVGPALGRGLAGLSHRDREVLLMYAWADLSPDEIAEALDIPAGTVRSRLARGRRKLREALADAGWGPKGPRSLEATMVEERGGHDG